MKVAAAVLGASLLFFLGVLTGAGRREALPPPAAIRLGVGAPASPADPSPSPQTPGSTRATAKPPATGSNPSTATTATTTRTDVTVPPAPGVTTSTRGTGSGVPGTSTSTTADSGQVEQVDNQVDCRPAGKPGKGKREPCPTTASTAEAPVGGGDR